MIDESSLQNNSIKEEGCDRNANRKPLEMEQEILATKTKKKHKKFGPKYFSLNDVYLRAASTIPTNDQADGYSYKDLPLMNFHYGLISRQNI